MRRGSLAYWPHRRAKRQLPRVRNWHTSAEPGFSGFVGVKAGMTHVALIDDSESASKGSEVTRAATVIEFPKVFIYGARFYGKHEHYRAAATEVHDKNAAQKVGMKNVSDTPIEAVKKDAAKYTDVTALAFCDESNLGFGNKSVMRFELPVGGKGIGEKIAFIEKWMGKEVKASDVIKAGEYLDIASISTGKGWAGVIKRFGVARLARKATQKVRHVGTLGAWHPPKVLYTVPHAGHLGYNYRTEFNKRILKLGNGTDAASVNVKGGYVDYGVVKNDFMLLDGSIPGPSKRLVRIRKAIRSTRQPKTPNLTYISLESKQGA